MTIQEAIKSGRPFTRPGVDGHLIVHNGQIINVGADCMTIAELDTGSILADDWELKPEGPRDWWLAFVNPGQSDGYVMAFSSPPDGDIKGVVRVREVLPTSSSEISSLPNTPSSS